VALAGLNEGVVSPNKEILSVKNMEVPNPYDPSNPTLFSDWKAHGYVNVFSALAYSSNVYFYQVAGGYTPTGQKGVGITKLEEYYKLFGFGSDVDDEFLGGQKGTIPNPKWKADNFDGDDWRLGDTYFTAIGQCRRLRYKWSEQFLQLQMVEHCWSRR
jgi:penicillin-binding protein 2